MRCAAVSGGGRLRSDRAVSAVLLPGRSPLPSLKHRERPGAFDGDPSAAAGEKKRQDVAGDLAAAQDSVMQVDIRPAAIVGREETGKLGVSIATA